MTRPSAKVWLSALSALMVAVLAGCYLPNNFISEIRISKTGDFAIMYEGDLIYAPLVQEIRAGKLTPEKLAEKEATIERDLTRDSNFERVVKKGNGAWAVRYEREGRLQDSDMVTFVRRNARILIIKASPNGVVGIVAEPISAKEAQQMGELGLNTSGEFRITTDAEVLKHNASEVRAYGPYKVYIWTIDSVLSPTPQFVMKREVR